MKNGRMKVPLAFIVAAAALRLSSNGEDPAVSYKDAVLADKPLAYYRLGESANTQPVADEIGNNAGAYVNGPKVGVPIQIRAVLATASGRRPGQGGSP